MTTTESSEQRDVELKSKKVEDKTRVTPFAFSISEHLLDKPLASPTRRLIALIIDLLCVAILSTLNALFLASLAAITFVRANIRLAHQKRFKRTRIALSFIIAILLFFIVYGVLDAISDVQNDSEDSVITGKQALVSAAMYLAWQECNDLECKRQVSTDFGESFAATNIPAAEFEVLAKDLVNTDDSIPEFERGMLAIEAIDVFTRVRQEQAERDAAATEQDLANTENKEIVVHDPYSLIEWIKGIVSDLGLGFGWAALYFSAIPTYFNGATLGKKLLGIYVVRLDGGTPTLWENFGRYGGYGAGLATGLMGFLQVFWDANRQAIQDKISETLVLRKQ